MIRWHGEQVKTYILMFLVMLSIVLTGNLWISDNRGLSFIFGKYYGAESELSGTLKEKMQSALLPYRIVVSDGDGYHWILNNSSSQSYEQYKHLWQEAAPILSRVLERKYEKLEQVPTDEWIRLISARKMKIDFKTGLDPILLRELLNAPPKELQVTPQNIPQLTPLGLNNLHSVIIAPWENINSSYVEVYIKEADEKVYKVTVSLDASRQEAFDAIFRSIKGSSQFLKYRTFYDDKLYTKPQDYIDPGIYYTRPADKKEFKYPLVKFINEYEGSFDSSSNLNAFKDKFFKNDTDELRLWNKDDKSKVILFKNKDEILRVYPDGFMEYYNISSVHKYDRGQLLEAYETAMSFLLDRWELQKGVSLYLSGMSVDDKGVYTFSFDYEVAGIPLVVQYRYGDGFLLNNAVNIRAAGKNVESCLRYMKKAEILNKYDSVIDMYTAIDQLHKQRKIDKKEFIIRDIFLGFDISGIHPQNPYWFFWNTKGERIPIDAVNSGKGGDYGLVKGQNYINSGLFHYKYISAVSNLSIP